ncbi:MAG TPA: CHAT domain-containing protein [Blastocatellia bacterium]|nr:CHAT domain-containing protein [Blastocatellia bacterium]
MKHPFLIKTAFLIGLSIVCLPPVARSQNSNPIAPAQPIERELAAGQTHSYDLMMAAEQFLKIEIQFKRYSGAIAVYGPDNRMLAETRSGGDLSMPTNVALIIPADGRYRIEVRSPDLTDKNAAAGRYQMMISKPRIATEEDRHYAIAQRALDEANGLLEKKTVESRRQAVAKLQQSLPEWRAAGDQRREAETLHSLTMVWNLLGDSNQAMAAGQEYLAISRAMGDRRQEATGLSELGTIFNRLGDRRKGAEFHRQAMLLSRELGNRNQEMISLNNLGVSYGSMGDLQQALNYYLQALPLARELGNRGMEARLLNNIGLQYSSLGDVTKALEYCQESLALRRALGVPEEQITSLHNLSLIWFRSGKYQQALDSDKEALSLAIAAGNRQFQVLASTLLGQIHLRLGEYSLAEEYLNQALKLSREAGYKDDEAGILTNLGNLHLAREQVSQALNFYEQAISLHRALGSRTGLTTDLSQLGLARLAQGETRQAIEHFNQALQLSRELGYPRIEASVLERLGRAHRMLGEWPKAAELLQQSLDLSRSVNAVYTEREALYELAQLAIDRGDYPQAQTRAEQAVKLIETARANVDSPDLRATYRGKAQKIYEILVEALVRQHEQNPAGDFAARAFEASEQSRARSLIELLNEARANIRQDVAPELREQEQVLQQQLIGKSERLARMRAADLNKEQTIALKGEIAALIAEYDALQTRIRQTSPRYAALIAPEPLKLSDIQKQVLDGNTLLLEYSLGERQSYLFAVTAEAIHSFTLPGRKEIETKARLFYDLVTQRGTPGVFRSASESRQWLERKDQECATAALTLSRTLLAPAAELLDKKRLLIVSDGILHYVPFAALPSPTTKRQGDSGTARTKNTSPVTPSSRRLIPLVVNHEILSLPSASVLVELRRETVGREAARKTIAVLADPVFEENDERIRSKTSAEAGATSVKKRDEWAQLRDATMGSDLDSPSSLARLPFTRREAEKIVTLVPEAERRLALGFEASRALALSPELGQYRYIHFATHGLLNNAHPELSGLAFSLFDEQARKQNGFLRGMDVYNLRLPAELVVLSGCRTALGTEVSGEGLVGLTRGFMYAGAKRVMAGLWKVDDAATAELMQRFYQQMLGEQHSTPAAALRAAQVSMWREPRSRSPFYWAAFVLQGEW